jgi:hypothetical protein
MMKERGSVSVFFLILLPFLLILALFLVEFSYYRFLFHRHRAQMYLYADQVLSDFERPLFLELGLFAVEGEGDPFHDPLSESDVLKDSILRTMEGHLLLEGVYFAEDLVGEFMREKMHIELEVFDLSGLNRELQSILDGESVDIPGFLLKLAASSAYARLEGVSARELEQLLLAGDLEAIRELSPVFVIKEEIRKSYSTFLEYAKKYDVLNVLGSYQLADYAVDYLGYSLTKAERDTLHSEYILTGVEERTLRRALITAELFGLRMVFNVAEILVNPQLREKVEAASFGDPRLFILETLVLASAESGFDVSDILQRRPIPLYKGEEGFQSFSFGRKNYREGWAYPDYLKIMLMLVPESWYLSRMKNAIEHNFEADLTSLYTAWTFHEEMTFTGKVLPYEMIREIKGGLSYVYESGFIEY